VNREIVQIGAFSDEPSAWLARAVLEANGIPSQVVSTGSTERTLPVMVRARLAVRAEDAAEALAILNAPPADQGA